MLESPLQHGLCGSPRPQAFSGPGYEVRARELQNKETCTKMCSEARTCLGQKLTSHTRPQQLLSVALHLSSRGSQSWLPIRITWRDRNTPGRSASTLGLLSQDLGGWEPSLNRLSGSQMIPMCSHGGGGAPPAGPHRESCCRRTGGGVHGFTPALAALCPFAPENQTCVGCPQSCVGCPQQCGKPLGQEADASRCGCVRAASVSGCGGLPTLPSLSSGQVRPHASPQSTLPVPIS